ncbi:uncharacterized protein LOC136090585 [Hydra vulgaris]|uniref:Uncharacterized protein LOC136090585 n=1 Tax=Hydra vulgaris TaxID=6087 RepID=A0ABM4DG90_HYDVU
MSNIGAKRKRFKVECLKCGSIFNNDFKKQHHEKEHNGILVNIKHVGAPENPFQSAVKTSKVAGKRESNHETCHSQMLEEDLFQENSIQMSPIDEPDIQNDEVNWLSCAGQLENIVTDLSECGTILSKLKSERVPNPVIFLLESIQVISRIKSSSKEFLKNANILSEQISKSPESSKPINNIIDNIINHDPGSRDSVASASQRQYLIALGPHQPK